jgi:hypothetical protein
MEIDVYGCEGESCPGSTPGAYATASVDTVSGSPGGFVTYALTATLSAATSNVYSIFGHDSMPLSIPAAYQVATPFGVDVGGANPAFFASTPEAEYDSWLTVGATDGSAAGQIATVGLDFASWTESAGLAATDAAGGAVFWMLPDDGPSGSAVVAQLTVAVGTSATVTMGLQGRRAGASANDDLDDWQQALSFDVSGGTPPGLTYATASVDTVSGSPDGWTTYQLTATSARRPAWCSHKLHRVIHR